MGLKKNGKKVRLQLHESVDSQESLEMDEYSDEDDEVFVRHDRDNEEAGKPLIKSRKKVEFKKMNHTLHIDNQRRLVIILPLIKGPHSDCHFNCFGHFLSKNLNLKTD